MRASVTLREPNPRVGYWRGGLVAVRNIWAHRGLIREFTARDVRLKYRNSSFGYLWSLLEPLLLAVVYVVLFTLIAHRPDRTFPLAVVLGVISWGFFGQALNKAQVSLTNNASLIQNIYFPREVFAIAGVMAQLVISSLSLLVAVPFMIYLGLPPTWHLLYVPIGMALITMLALGLGMGTAGYNVLNRDIEHFSRFVIRAGMYVSPVMWTVHTLAETRAAALKYLLLNPVAVPMTLIGDGVMGRTPALGWGHFAYAVAFAVLALLWGLATFRRMEGVVVKKL